MYRTQFGHQSMAAIPVVTTPRLRFEAFTEADIPALAAILAEPEVTKNITANGSTPERCRASAAARIERSEEHTSELQSLMRISYDVSCLKQKTHIITKTYHISQT